MNRLNKIILSFALPFFCLLISVSYAGIEPDATYTANFDFTSVNVSKVGTYSISTLYTNLNNYYLGNEDGLTTIMDDLIANKIIDKWYVWYNTSNKPRLIMLPYEFDGEIFYCETETHPFYVCFPNPTSSIYYWELTASNNCTQIKLRNSNYNCKYIQSATLFNPQFSVKSLDKVTDPTTGYQWDGTSYYYKAETEEPDSPSLPSNAEIAQAVQAFYDSDYYKNNKDFSDFMLLYNTTNGNCSFVGHTLGNILGQVIIPPNYRYQGRLYNEQWWKFYIDENQGALPYSSTYHLYNSNISEPNIISDEGIGKISELVNLNFSTKSTIVYSTTDYPVRTYVLDETTGDYTYTDGTIVGDQYTYDENLDPTISGYNPLDNFVTVDPAQTIVGNADFDGLSNSFENHKDLFSFTENMQWLIAANNKLSNYFLGFIIMCALFITLGRVLKG